MAQSLFDLHKNREIRIFISSTFRDMMNERGTLVKKVFPELRKKFKDRGVVITEVDLRWGVLQEEAESGKVIDICLTEIDKSRPYFIGLLGERYGWVPDKSEYEKHKQIIENFSWVKDDIENGLSITEMEVQYGVLRNQQMHERSFFYLRDPQNEDSKKHKEEENSTAKQKLIKLKEKLHDIDTIKSEEYSNKEDLAKKVFNDLAELIDKDFPALGEEVKEVLPQLNFIKTKTDVYIKEEKYFNIIDEHIARTSSPIVLTGKTGAGKSTLAANYLYEYSNKNPEDILLYNFSNASADSSNHIATLKRFCESLSGSKINLDMQFTENTEARLKNYFFELIESKKPQKVLIVIDGLDEYDNENESLLLNWLPDYYPENTSVIYTLGAGTSLDRLKAKRFEIVYITEPNEETKKSIINNYLGKYSKKLPAGLIDKVISDDLSELPLTLRAFLDELRQFGVHEELDNIIGYYAKADGPIEFYDKILERLEKDFEENKKGIVSEIFTALYLVKSGLTEPELLKILDIPALYWTPIFNSIEDSLLNINGFIHLGHKYLEQAVENRYLSNVELRNSICNKIISVFNIENTDNRMIAETANQYVNSENKAGLFEHLSNIFNIMALYEDTPTKLLKYWRFLSPDYTPADIYTDDYVMKFIDERDFEFAEAVAIFTLVGKLFKDVGDIERAKYFFESVYEVSRKNLKEDNPFMLAMISRLVLLYLELSDYENADKFSRLGVEFAEKYLDKENENYIAALTNRALVLSDIGMTNEAIKIYELLLGELEQDDSKKSEIQNILNNLSAAYFKNNEIEKAINISLKGLELTEQELGKEHPDNITQLNNIGFILGEIGKIKESINYLSRSYELSKENYGEVNTSTISIGLNIVGSYLNSGENENAINLLNDIEKVLPKGEVYNDLIGRFYNAKANYFSHLRKYDQAIGLQKEALSYLEKIKNPYHNNTIINKRNLIQYLMHNKQLDEAEKLANELLELQFNKYSKDSIELTELYNLLGGLYREKGDNEKAFEFVSKALEIRRAALGDQHPDTIKNAHNLAALFIDNEQYEDAKQFIETILEIIVESLGKDSPQYYETIDLLSQIYLETGHWKELEENLKSGYEYYKARTGNSINTYTYLLRLISAKDKLGYFDQIDHLLPQAIEMCSEVYGKSSQEYQFVLNDAGFQYSSHEKYDEALNCFNELYTLQSEVYGEAHSETLTTLNNTASVHFKKGELDKAREIFSKLIKTSEEQENAGEDNSNIYANIAKLELDSGNLIEAEKYYKLALEKSIENLGNANQTTLNNLYSLGSFLENTDRFEEANELYQKYMHGLSAEKEGEARYEVMDYITNLFIRKKDYEPLKDFLKEKLELSYNVFGKDTPQTFKTLVNLAFMYNITFDDKKAIEIMNKINEEISQKTMVDAGKVYVDNYVKLISCYSEPEEESKPDEELIEEFKNRKVEIDKAIETNDLNTALSLLQKNIESAQKLYGQNHPETIFSKKKFAETLIDAGYYQDAENILNEITGIIAQSLGETHHEYQLTIYLIAKCKYNMQQYDEALRVYKDVYDQVVAILEKDHPFVYKIKRDIAETLFFSFKSDEALELYNELLSVTLQAENINEPEVAHFKIRMGELYLRLQNYDLAIQFLDEADELYAKLFDGQANPYTIMIPELKAFIMWKLEDLDSAEKLYLTALANSKQLMPAGHPAQMKILKSLAKFYFDYNRFNEALTINMEILEIMLSEAKDDSPSVLEQKLVIALIKHNLQDDAGAIEVINDVLQHEDVQLTEYSQKIINNLYNYYSSQEDESS